jgi:hypothetical protein
MPGTIIDGGLGGFLCPPTHPAHSHCVRYRNSRISFFSALEASWVDKATKDMVRHFLNSWQPIPLADVMDWVHQVLGYFRHSYGSGSAKDLVFHSDWDPMEHVDEHAGVHHIRRYYPGYKPTREDFEQAYWN